MKTLLQLDLTNDANHVEFSDNHLSIFMPRKQWEREGSPSEITVTIEPGNKLRR